MDSPPTVMSNAPAISESLLNAIASNSVSEVARLIQDVECLKGFARNGNNAVHFACMSPYRIDAARLVIDAFVRRGLSLDSHNDRMATALTMAIDNKNLGAVAALLNAGANPNMAGAGGPGWSPLRHAIALLSPDAAQMITLLIAHSADVRNFDTHSREDTLLLAVNLNRPEAVAALLTSGYESLVEEGAAGLFFAKNAAVRQGHHPCAEVLKAWVSARMARKAMDQVLESAAAAQGVKNA